LTNKVLNVDSKFAETSCHYASISFLNKSALLATSEKPARLTGGTMTIAVKTLVKDTTAEFVCYKDGDLWYRITGTSETDGNFVFNFPVPTDDTGIGIFPAKIKAITLMRWVRQHLESIENDGEDAKKLPEFD